MRLPQEETPREKDSPKDKLVNKNYKVCKEIQHMRNS